MLKSWQVKHFKAIVEAQTMEPGGVTILTGLNNSGKSSFLQSILMIADTLNSPLKDHPLLLSSVSHSGIDNEILSDTADDQTLGLNFELMLPVQNDENRSAHHSGTCVCREVTVAASFRFDSTQHNTKHTSDQDEGRVSHSAAPRVQSLDITFSALNEENEKIAFHLEHVSEEMKQQEGQVFAANYRLAHKRLLPYRGHFSVNGQQLPGKYQVLEFAHFLPRSLQPHPSERHQATKQTWQLESKYLALLDETVDQIEHFFSQQVHYLGPQRTNSSPSPLAMRSRKNRNGKVGSKGEYAATLYHKHRSEVISWYDPTEKQEEQQIKSSSLENAVNCWVQYLGIASSVTVRERPYGIFSWQVKQPRDGKSDVPSAGGSSVSQVLPLLVMGLLAERGSLLLVEQPEVSLHQSVQARLGDFFVGLAMCDKQCLIETQSENLVTQLRYHIVREGGHDPDRYMLYFADRDDEGFAQFTPIEISPRGAIVNWPEGFFSETLIQEENIRFAYMKKKFETQAQQASERGVVQQGGEQVQDAEHFG